MKRVLFITSQYRVGERVYPILPILASEYSLDLLKVYQMTNKHPWVGDVDPRSKFDEQYLHLFDSVFQDSCDVSNYDLIISDDNRHTSKTKLANLYKQKNCPMVSFEHGNNDKDYFKLGHGVVFDKSFVFGEKDVKHKDQIVGGIPSNDTLSKYINSSKKHILVIVNFLGNRTSPFKVNFDDRLFKKLDLVSLQNNLNLPVVIKLKSRADEGGYTQNIKYLQSILPNELYYKIIIDSTNDNKLIAESKCVISSPSTFAFKPIQLGIPTIIIKDSGQIGSFYDYDGLFDIDKINIEYLLKDTNNHQWVTNSVEGGINFNSSEIVVSKLKEIL
tara:strand:- start:4450 stop:5442 length:993 start_codon:yes stop_codon:yes gene_type:complete